MIFTKLRDPEGITFAESGLADMIMKARNSYI